MKLDYQFILLLCGIGIVARRLTWKGWFSVALLTAAWMTYNFMRG